MAQESEDTGAALKLRAPNPPVVRLSRRVLIGAAALAALAIAGAVGWGLLSKPRTAADDTSVATAPALPEKVDALPHDYSLPKDVPRLGPPLPGDLGRPILASQEARPSTQAASPANGSAAASTADQEREAARTSHLFGVSGQAMPAEPPAVERATTASVPPPPAAVGVGGASLLDAAPDRRTVAPDRLTPPPSPFALQAGAVIAAALVTGIRSDLPGEVIGQVTEDVFDSVTGRYLLVPAGSRLVGRYDSQVSFGQTRVLLAWSRLILPNGRSIALENLPGADASGFAGLQDRVDHHWGTLMTAAALSSLLSVGTELESSGSETDLAAALRRAGVDAANQVGQQVVGKALSIPPSLTIRPGERVKVILTHDLVLEPYRA